MQRKKDEKVESAEGEEMLGALFLNTIQEEQGIKNDAELARDLDVLPPVISNIRNGRRGVSAEVIIRIHEAYDISISRIKQMLRVSEVKRVTKRSKK